MSEFFERFSFVLPFTMLCNLELDGTTPHQTFVRTLVKVMLMDPVFRHLELIYLRVFRTEAI